MRKFLLALMALFTGLGLTACTTDETTTDTPSTEENGTPGDGNTTTPGGGTEGEGNTTTPEDDLEDADQVAADEVSDLIAALGTEASSSQVQTAATEARTAYDALTEAQQALVTNLEKLTNLETAIADFKAADEVSDLIAALGTEASSSQVQTAATEARTAYDALTEAQQALVTNLEKLTNLETAIADFKAAEAESAANQVAADEVSDLIAALGENYLSADVQADVVTARAAYDALTEAQKELVTNLKKLTDLEESISEVPQPNEPDVVIPEEPTLDDYIFETAE